MAFAILEILELRIEDPFAIEGNVGIRHRAFAAGNQAFLAAIGVQQHQVPLRIHVQGERGIGPAAAVWGISFARRPHVHDVIIVFDRGIRRNLWDGNIEWPLPVWLTR